MLGHELRNPLSPIMTALQLMRLRGDTRSFREQEVIERQVRHLIRLVDDLLDVSRVARGKVELTTRPTSLADVVAQAVEVASPIIEERRHRLEVKVARQGLLVLGDRIRLAQVLANLIINAANYTEPGGQIVIAAEREGDEVVARVRDNGAGISAELLPRVFEMFVQGDRTADRRQGGLGLGLALVRSFVTLHGGTVTAHSEGPGRGSELVVRLPALALDAVPVERAPSPLEPVSEEAVRRILVVDDNEDAAELLATLLSGLGHEVKMAHDGPQALALAPGFHPEIAILDIGLPVMTGHELAARMRAGDERLTLIALTGYGQDDDRERSRRAGFDAHLVKPVDVEALVRLVSAPLRPPTRTPGHHFRR
jgi:CheY-like chemotaxis protein